VLSNGAGLFVISQALSKNHSRFTTQLNRAHNRIMIKAALYLRSSKDRADMSIDAQRRQLIELAQQREMMIVEEFADAVESGKDDDRPGFQNMLRQMRNKSRGWDHILVLDTARIARRRHISIIFEEHECKRNDIKVVYKSLPDSDPITEMLLKSILQAMDEWHSLTSKVKGLAGMAENVKQGWRAGGIAPRGYKLEKTDTGTVREGVAVTKSKLILSDEALLIRSYLQSRARGVSRAKALAATNLDIPITSLLGMERNALTYAGHTVWNRHAETHQTGYVGGQKYRPRSEWVISKNTHEAIITDEEAEKILALVGSGYIAERPSKRNYIFTGLLKSPDGDNWKGDSGDYRLGKGKRIKAEILEKAILTQVIEDLSGDELTDKLLANYKALANKDKSKPVSIEIKKEIAAIDSQVTKIADLLPQTTKPAALLRKIEELEASRELLEKQLAEEIEEEKADRFYKQVGRAEIKAVLRTLAEEIGEGGDDLKEALAQFIKEIVLTPDASSANISYDLEKKSGLQLASPRGREPKPAFSISSVVYFRKRQA
jgi:site-specific DNA recombinase